MHSGVVATSLTGLTQQVQLCDPTKNSSRMNIIFLINLYCFRIEVLTVIIKYFLLNNICGL